MPEQKRKTTSRLIIAAISLVLSFPLTGFIYGFFSCEDCGSGVTGIMGKLFKGFSEAVATTMTLGDSWTTDSGIATQNLRAYIFLTFIVLTFTIIYFRERKKQKSKTI